MLTHALAPAEIEDLKRSFPPAHEPAADPAPPPEGDPGAIEWPDSANGEPDYGAEVATAEESDCLEEWDAGDDDQLPPPREWLLGNQFCRKFLSACLPPVRRANLPCAWCK